MSYVRRPRVSRRAGRGVGRSCEGSRASAARSRVSSVTGGVCGVSGGMPATLPNGSDSRREGITTNAARLTTAAAGERRNVRPGKIWVSPCGPVSVGVRFHPLGALGQALTKRQTLCEEGTQSHGAPRASRTAESAAACVQLPRRSPASSSGSSRRGNVGWERASRRGSGHGYRFGSKEPTRAQCRTPAVPVAHPSRGHHRGWGAERRSPPPPARGLRRTGPSGQLCDRLTHECVDVTTISGCGQYVRRAHR